MSLEGIFQYLGIKLTSAIAGLIGAVISLKFVKRNIDGWGKTGLIVGGGFFAAGYCEPPISGYFNIEYGGFIAFLLGLFGMSLVAVIMEFINTRLLTVIQDFINKRTGG